MTSRSLISGRSATRLAVLLVASLSVALGVASSAQARWGKEKCSLATHCYALANWEMEGGSESVKGAEVVPTTNVINAQEWEGGAFVDDEEWVSFPNKSDGWLETGQTAGYTTIGRTDCCTRHPFIALSLNGEGYGYEEYVWTTVTAEPTNVYSIEDPSANSDWCFIINGTNQGCKSKTSYWSEYSDHLEAGIEAASSNTQPENEGSHEVDGITHSGTHIEWKGAKTHSVLETVNYKGESVAGVMCISPNTKSNYYGNAIWSIC